MSAAQGWGGNAGVLTVEQPSRSELDQVIDRAPQPGVEVGELFTLLVARVREVVDDHDLLAVRDEARHVIAVLAHRERHERATGIALLQAPVPIT